MLILIPSMGTRNVICHLIRISRNLHFGFKMLLRRSSLSILATSWHSVSDAQLKTVCADEAPSAYIHHAPRPASNAFHYMQGGNSLDPRVCNGEIRNTKNDF